MLRAFHRPWAFAFSLAVLMVLGTSTQEAKADSFTSTAVTTAWNASRWNNSADGPGYTATYTANNAVQFTTGNYTFAGMGATTNVGNVTLLDGVTVTFTSAASTYATGGLIRTLTVGTGSILDLGSQAISTAAGTGFIKNGAGILYSANGNTYVGGFTLNAGTVVLGSTLALGGGGAAPLTINGGTISASATRSMVTGRYSSINIGGNFTIGGTTTGVTSGNAIASANISFADPVALGALARTITIGGTGTYTFSGIVSGTVAAPGPGLIVSTTSTGTLVLSNSANTFTGGVQLNAGANLTITTSGALIAPVATQANYFTLDSG